MQCWTWRLERNFSEKGQKGTKKYKHLRTFFTIFLKGTLIHATTACMKGLNYALLSIIFPVFQLCYWYIFVHYLYARLIFFQIKQRVSVLAFFKNFNNINVIRQYSHFKTIMLNINIFGPYWLYNTTNWFVSILSLTAVSLHY